LKIGLLAFFDCRFWRDSGDLFHINEKSIHKTAVFLNALFAIKQYLSALISGQRYGLFLIMQNHLLINETVLSIPKHKPATMKINAIKSNGADCYLKGINPYLVLKNLFPAFVWSKINRPIPMKIMTKHITIAPIILIFLIFNKI